MTGREPAAISPPDASHWPQMACRRAPVESGDRTRRRRKGTGSRRKRLGPWYQPGGRVPVPFLRASPRPLRSQGGRAKGDRHLRCAAEPVPLDSSAPCATRAVCARTRLGCPSCSMGRSRRRSEIALPTEHIIRLHFPSGSIRGHFRTIRGKRRWLRIGGAAVGYWARGRFLIWDRPHIRLDTWDPGQD